MRHNIQHKHGKGQTGAAFCFSESFNLNRSTCQRPQLTPGALANGHRVPCGHEQNTPTMPRREPFGSLGASRCPSSGRARRGRDDEEDEGNVTDDEGDDEEDDGGYSVQVRRLCQW